MRAFIVIALSTTLLASTAFAGDAFAGDVGPLAPGKPAGVKQAEMTSTTWVLVGVGVVAAVAIGVASSSNGSPLNSPQNIAVTTTTI